MGQFEDLVAEYVEKLCDGKMMSAEKMITLKAEINARGKEGVDYFLRHLPKIELSMELGEEFARRFKRHAISKRMKCDSLWKKLTRTRKARRRAASEAEKKIEEAFSKARKGNEVIAEKTY